MKRSVVGGVPNSRRNRPRAGFSSLANTICWRTAWTAIRARRPFNGSRCSSNRPKPTKERQTTTSPPDLEALLRPSCPACGKPMRLVGLEPDLTRRFVSLHTYECQCGEYDVVEVQHM